MRKSVADIIESHRPEEILDTLHGLENRVTELKALGNPVPHPLLHDIATYKQALQHVTKGTP